MFKVKTFYPWLVWLCLLSMNFSTANAQQTLSSQSPSSLSNSSAGSSAGSSGGNNGSSTKNNLLADQIDEIIAEVSYNNIPDSILFLQKLGTRFYIDEADLLEEPFDLEALQQIPRQVIGSCLRCITLSDLGEVTFNERTGSINIKVHALLAKPITINLAPNRSINTAPLQRRFAIQVPISASVAYQSESNLNLLDDNNRQSSLIFIKPSISLGRYGTLRTGLRSIDSGSSGNQSTDRLATFIENHFLNQSSTLIIGETITDGDLNDSRLPITGIRFFRNLAIRPDLTDQPIYDYFTLIERPSIIEIYQNSELIKRQQINQPGQLSIEDFTPSANGRIRIFVTDSLGFNRILETELLVNQANLGQGQLDYGFAFGQRRINEKTDNKTAAASYRLNYGMTNNLTLGMFGETLFTEEESVNFSGNRRVSQFGWRALATTRAGIIDATHKASDNSNGDRGFSTTIGYRNAFRLTSQISSFFTFAFFDDDDYFTITGAQRDRSGYQSSLTLGSPQLTAFYQTGKSNGFTSHTLGLSKQAGRFLLQLSGSKLEGFEPLFLFNINYRYHPNHSFASGAAFRQEPRRISHYVEGNGNLFNRSLGYRARLNLDNAEERRGIDVNVNYRNPYTTVSYSVRANESTRQQLLTLTSGLAYGGGSSWYIGPRLSNNSGLLRVKIDQSQASLSLGGLTQSVNSSGEALFPIGSFRDQTVTLDDNSLPDLALAKTNQISVRTFPGQAALAQFTTRSMDAFLQIKGLPLATPVKVNGQRFFVYEFGIFTDALIMGNNIIEVGQRRYQLNINQFSEVLPTFFLTDDDLL